MADIPQSPDNPFNGGGAEKNIDAQRAMLNDLIANQGQAGRDIYSRQAPEAQAMLGQRLTAAGPVPAARQAVYDAFTQDARAAEQQQTNTMQRQAQLGNVFLDQAKAAVPIYSKNADLASQAMRQQFEERQAAQAASRSGGGSSSSAKTVEQLIAEGMKSKEVKTGTARSILEASGVPKSQWATSDIMAAGLSGGKGSTADALSVMGVPSTVKDGVLRNKEALDITQSTIDELWNGDKDVNFEQVKATVDALIETGVASEMSAYAVLLANAPRWGLSINDLAALGVNSDRFRGNYR